MLFQCVLLKFKSAPTLKHDEPMTADQHYFQEIDNLLKTIDIMLNDSRNFLVYTPNTNYAYHFLPQWSISCFSLDNSSQTISYNGGLIYEIYLLFHLHHLFTLTILSGLRRRMTIGTKIPKFMSGMQPLRTNGKLQPYHQVGEILPLPWMYWHHDNDDGPNTVK